MGTSAGASAAIIVAWLVLFEGVFVAVTANFNYKDALSKSLIFLEAQRSGKLPPNNRLPWRGDSALDDGMQENVDLSGGYYDAGDNVKYGFPMAFTVTTLSWAAIFYKAEVQAAGELGNLQSAIRWGTDYFLKCASRRKRLYVQVGDPVLDHQCWMRPENMKTMRPIMMIDENTPGTEIAAETSAAMAASSMVFRSTDRVYARRLLNKAKWLFLMAKTHKGTFDGECPFYCSSSGYNDELMWAASWLYMATKRPEYLVYIKEEAISGYVADYNWDIKYAGAQILLSQLYFNGDKSLESIKVQADSYVCSTLPDSPFHQVYLSPGGLVYIREGANTQYGLGAAYLLSIYGDLLTKYNQNIYCGAKLIGPADLHAFAKQQVDYILGNNPKGISYMVGFGTNSPKQAHHRGASVPAMSPNMVVSCPASFQYWFTKDVPNVNELTGAIVGGPDRYDNFADKRWESTMTEPTTYVNALAFGAIAKLTSYN